MAKIRKFIKNITCVLLSLLFVFNVFSIENVFGAQNIKILTTDKYFNYGKAVNFEFSDTSANVGGYEVIIVDLITHTIKEQQTLTPSSNTKYSYTSSLLPVAPYGIIIFPYDNNGSTLYSYDFSYDYLLNNLHGSVDIVPLGANKYAVGDVRTSIFEVYIPIETLTIDGPAKIAINETHTYSGVFTPKEATHKDLIWTSTENATINEKGELTATAEGEVTLTAKSLQSGIIATKTIYITPPLTAENKLLDKVVDFKTAKEGLEDYIYKMTPEMKTDAREVEKLTVFLEHAISQSSTVKIDETNFSVNKTVIDRNAATLEENKAKLIKTVTDKKIELAREISPPLRFYLDSDKGEIKNVKIATDAKDAQIKDIIVVDSKIDMYFSRDLISESKKNSELDIAINIIETDVTALEENINTSFFALINNNQSNLLNSTSMFNNYFSVAINGFNELQNGTFANRTYLSSNIDNSHSTPQVTTKPTITARKTKKTYGITQSKQTENNTKYTVPTDGLNPLYTTVMDGKGRNLGSTQDPITRRTSWNSNQSGEYTPVENKIYFTDIDKQHESVQEAILYLAARGVIEGTNGSKFSPEKAVTRAEITSILVKSLSKLEPNLDGGFKDVKKADWYFGAVGSSKKLGIISGYDDNTFRGDKAMIKEQLIAVCARTLKAKMKYISPDPEKVLAIFKDKDAISDWAASDIALATKEKLFTFNTNNKFSPKNNYLKSEVILLIRQLYPLIN